MSKAKLRDNGLCADCCAPEAGWASVNRGVIICDECCSVHRSLGRHISYVKSLRKGIWVSNQLQMVHQLVSLGANNIWEHTLLDPGQSSNKQTRRKPSPHDPLHPTKADFIRAKYLVLAFAKKAEIVDSSLDDLNQQLHSCVRTSNLEITLRLLSQGADPNVLNTERGNYPLHVAAQSGQPTQVELLIVYGADPGAADVQGRTPRDIAKAEGYPEIVERLVECEYELTDRLSYYLCGRKPDHHNQDFIIPQMADTSLDLSELAKMAKKKLKLLPNRMFEELAMDVFDEVDRRENDAVWLSTQSHSTLVTDRQSVPFLPVNPELSATRNQGRQKLARFNAREFATLVIDILMEAKRRQLGLEQYPPVLPSPVDHRDSQDDFLSETRNTSLSYLSDDEPLYDEVASEEDYSSIDVARARENRERLLAAKKKGTEPPPVKEAEATSPMDPPAEIPAKVITIPAEEFNEVKKSLSQSEAKVQQMALVNRELKQEVNKLHTQVTQLMSENESLKSQQPVSPPEEEESHVTRRASQSPTSRRPQSMFESRDQQKPTPRTQLPLVMESEVGPAPAQPPASPRRLVHSANSKEEPMSPVNNEPDYDQVYQSTGPAVELPPPPEPMPSQDDVVRKTERITKKIQELLISAQEGKHASYVACSDKIHTAVIEMATIFPEKPSSESVAQALSALTSSALRLKEECRSEPADSRGHLDYRLKTQQVIQCAYDIAKAAKQLVTLFQ